MKAKLMTKYYIYKAKDRSEMVRETYVKKDAERYRKAGFFITSRTKKPKSEYS